MKVGWSASQQALPFASFTISLLIASLHAQMNVNSTTWMTHMILPGMMERKRGSIVNVASAAGVHTMPLLAQYSAAKGYITMFTRGLSVECAKKNVTVSVVTPFYVATKVRLEVKQQRSVSL